MRPEARPLADAIEAIAGTCHVGNGSEDVKFDMASLRVAAVHALMTDPGSDGLAALRAAGSDAWIIAYEALSALRPVVVDGRLRLEADREGRKRRGSWYTPPAIVEAALDHALDPLLAGLDRIEDVAALRILDAAAGPGRFLLGAARRVAARLAELGAAEPRQLAARCVWGADLDPGALALARAVLEDFVGAADTSLADRLLCGDALRGSVTARPLALDGPSDGIAWADIEPFDVVLGNPPYRAGRLAALDAAHMKAVVPTAEYQLDPFALFLDRSARLARRRMALLVPTTWMSNHRGRRLRRWLLGAHRLEALVEVPVETFDAAVETAVAVFAIGDGPTRAPVPVVDLAGSRVATVHPDPSEPEAPLPLTRSPRAVALLAASKTWPTTLGQVTEINRGINPYHHTTHSKAQIAARVHHADHRVADDWSPELRGRDLPGAYRLDWKGDHWIHYGPWLKEPRAPRFFRGPRLLVRKILGETLHGVYIERDAYCDQSVYIARIADGCPYPPFALLACINSRLIATLVRARHQTHRTHFPQLKVGELRGLPLPPTPPDDPRWAALAKRAEALQAQPQQAGADGALREAIEAAVADVYGVSR